MTFVDTNVFVYFVDSRASREVLQQPAASKPVTSEEGQVRPLTLAADSWLLAADTGRASF